jgi:hypothetical protein
MSILDGDKTFSQPIAWSMTLFMAAFHIGAIAALFCTWRNLLASGRRDHDPNGSAASSDTPFAPFASAQQNNDRLCVSPRSTDDRYGLCCHPNVVVLVVTVVDPVAVFFAPVAAIRIFAPLLPFAMVPYQGWAQNRAKFLLRIYFFLGILTGSRRSCRPVTIVIELVGDEILQEAVPKRDIRFFLAQSCFAC